MQGRTTTALIRRLRWVLLALAVVVVYGVAGYMLLERWSFDDSLYMTVMTMTTVGFREVRPLDTGGRMFTLTLIVLGVGIALVGVSLAAAVIAEGELGGNTRRRRMTKRIDGLHDHFIVCAYGRVGRATVRELQAAGLPFVAVDPNEELRERMEADDVPFLVDDPSNEPVPAPGGDRPRPGADLRRGFRRHQRVTLTARSINPDLFIVARASERGTAERLERAGANRVVSPFVSSGRHMVRMAIDPSIVDVFDETARSIPVAERLVAAGSDLEGVPVGAVGAPILALRRADGSTVASPSADTTIHAGDVVLLLG